MLSTIQEILKQKNILFHQNQGVTVVSVANLHEGFGLTKDILYKIVDPKTVLYLSGGSTPKVLYEKLAEEESLQPGAVGIVDERFGSKFHDKSNEKMIKETGLTRYLQMRDIPFYPILQGKKREETAESYDEKFRSLNASFQKSVAILGIGPDGHTAGLPALNSKVKIQNSKVYDTDYDLVSEYHDTIGFYGERVTMTFLALKMMDLLLILAFGEEKKEALKKMFSEGSEEEIPARFFVRQDVSKKTLLITDQTL
jgi:6-phosphogluconolactonase